MKNHSTLACALDTIEIQEFKHKRRHIGVRILSAAGLLFALALIMVGVMPSWMFAQTSPCAQKQPDDFIVGGKEMGEVVTITEDQSFKGRIIVKNRSTLHFRNVEAEVNQDVLVCDSSTFKVEGTVMTINTPYFLGREFKGFSGGQFEFTNSFFINKQANAVSLILSDSRATMNFVNRTDRAHPELADQLFAWTTSMSGTSSATIADTYYDGEATGLFGNATLNFIRSRGLILWLNAFQPESGGTFTLPATNQTPINYRLDRTTPDVRGITYSINIQESTQITSGMLIVMTSGVPNAEITIRDSNAALGLIFLNQPSLVQLEGLRENIIYSELLLPIPSRRVKLERTRVWTWSLYGWGSHVKATDSEIGEVFSESIAGQTASVQLVRSKLTGNGGSYRASNPGQSPDPPVILVNDCDVYSNLTATNGGIVAVEGSRMFESGKGTASGGTLLADNGTVVALNSVLFPGFGTSSRGTGTIWRASINPIITVQEDGTRVVTFRGDAAIESTTQTFEAYTIDYAKRSSPSVRTQIRVSTTPVTDATLLTWNVPEDVDGGNYLVTLRVYGPTGVAYDITQPLRLPDQAGVMPYYLQNNGVEGLKTSGTKGGGLVTSVVIDPDERGLPVGTEIVNISEDGATLTEVALPESPITRRARAFVVVDVDKEVDTTVTIANLDEEDSKIFLTLLGEDGQVYDDTSVIVTGSGQISQPFKELFPSKVPRFQGSLRINSEAPFSVVALKTNGDINTPQLAALPVLDESDTSTTTSALLPYMTDGGTTKTQIILMNPTQQTLTGQVIFSAPNGTPLRVTVGTTEGSQFPYEIDPNGLLTLTTSGEGERAQTGYVSIKPETTGQAVPRASVLVRSAQENIVVWETGYNTPPLTTRARLFVEVTDKTKPSLAIVNPNTSAATVTLILRSSDGTTEIKRVTVTIPPNGQISQEVRQLMNIVLGAFVATLEITSDQPVYTIGLRQSAAQKTGFVTTALPVVNMQALPNRERFIFPYVVDGKGFRTQIMLMNVGNGAIGGSITYMVPDGDIQPVTFTSID